MFPCVKCQKNSKTLSKIHTAPKFIIDTYLYSSHFKLDFTIIVACIFRHNLRATSHVRLRARDHYTSSTLIGGKSGAGPSLLHTMLEGPTDYKNARWM